MRLRWVWNTYSVFAFFLGGETTKESNINDAESTLLVEAVAEDGVLGCAVDPGSTGMCL